MCITIVQQVHLVVRNTSVLDTRNTISVYRWQFTLGEIVETSQALPGALASDNLFMFRVLSIHTLIDND